MAKHTNTKKQKKHDPYISEYVQVGEKSGGATQGGIYRIKEGNNDVNVLFKQGREDGEVIAEFLSSRLYNLTTDKAAKCFLAKWDQNIDTTERNAEGLSKNVYIGSVFFDNYNDLFKEVGLEERARFAKLRHSDKVVEALNLIKTNEERSYGFEDLLASTLWQENRDVHWGNWGVTRDKEGKIDSAVAIDFGWAFHNIEDNVSLFGHKKYVVPGKPTNHFWDYTVDDRKLYLSEAFTAALDKVVNISPQAIRANVRDSLDEVGKFYDQEALKNFGQRIGMKKDQMKDLTIDNVAEYLSEKLVNRQKSLRDISTQIKLDLAITKDDKGQYQFNKIAIDELVSSNPDFFTNKKGNFHFRNLEHKADARFLSEAITNIVQHKEDISPTKEPDIQSKIKELVDKVIKYVDEKLSQLTISIKRSISSDEKENTIPNKKQKTEGLTYVDDHFSSEKIDKQRTQLKLLAEELQMRQKGNLTSSPDDKKQPKFEKSSTKTPEKPSNSKKSVQKKNNHSNQPRSLTKEEHKVLKALAQEAVEGIKKLNKTDHRKIEDNAPKRGNKSPKNSIER